MVDVTGLILPYGLLCSTGARPKPRGTICHIRFRDDYVVQEDQDKVAEQFGDVDT